jgi:CheY-like chemotaxis protein
VARTLYVYDDEHIGASSIEAAQMNRLRRDDDADGRRQSETASAFPRRRVPARPGRKRPRVVMIADDTVDGRELYSRHLRQRGYVVVTAEDGAAAVRVARQHRPDVIVMDLAMPQFDGLTAIEKIKQDARGQRARVILLTGYPMNAVARAARELGVDAYLTKPCLPHELERHVEALRGSS